MIFIDLIFLLPMFKVKLLMPGSIEPKRVSPQSAGLDIFTPYTILIPSGGNILVSTGLALELQPNTYGRIASCSGNSVLHGIEVGAGVIDADYRGEIKVLLYNHGTEGVVFRRGDKIAQLIVSPFINSYIIVRSEALSSTVRGNKGFGEMV